VGNGRRRGCARRGMERPVQREDHGECDARVVSPSADDDGLLICQTGQIA
jgi:hypothetical protein